MINKERVVRKQQGPVALQAPKSCKLRFSTAKAVPSLSGHHPRHCGQSRSWHHRPLTAQEQKGKGLG